MTLVNISRPGEASAPQPALSVSYDPVFKCCGQEDTCVRVYHFKTRGSLRDVSLTHKQGEWVVYVDNKRVANEKHSAWSIFTTKNMSVHFDIGTDQQTGSPIRGIITMHWHAGGPCWNYELVVNNVHVRHIWERQRGSQKVLPPEVVGPAPAEAPPLAIEAPRQDTLALLESVTDPAHSIESTLGSLPPAALGLPQPLFPMVSNDPSFVLFEVSQNPKGAMVRCCEPVILDPRVMIPTDAFQARENSRLSSPGPRNYSRPGSRQ